MISGCICGNAYKIGTGFDFIVSQRAVGTVTFMGANCAEINAWYGTSNWYGYLANNAAPGGLINVIDSSSMTSGPWVNSSYLVSGEHVSIFPCSFCEVTTTVSGNGSASVGGTAYGKYRIAGDSITLTFTPASGYKVKKIVVNGSDVSFTPAQGTGVVTHQIESLNDDVVANVYFVPSMYTVSCSAPSGGSVYFTKNGTRQTQTTTGSDLTVDALSFDADVDDSIVCVATPDVGKMVQNFIVEGAISSGGSMGQQSFSFSIFERESDPVYNCAVSFCDRTAVSATVVGNSGATPGATDDAIVRCLDVVDHPRTGIDERIVTKDDNGGFLAYVGGTYEATATAPTIFRTFNGWVNANGETVGSADSYTWTQGSVSVSITASYTDNPLYTENFMIGTSTSDAGTSSGTAYVAGCRATITRPNGTLLSGKWLGGTRTVTATATPTGWTFSGVYVSDTNATGGTKFYSANGASSVTFDNACDANIYAIFANGAAVVPSDVDQGRSSVATGSAASGMYAWENGSSNMTMTYRSKRFVASMPMAISTARVYSDGYSTGQTNDVTLKVLTFQSPDSTDSRATATTAKSQGAYRMPMRRPEKYIEIEVSAPHQVTHVAVATGMEALWQN